MSKNAHVRPQTAKAGTYDIDTPARRLVAGTFAVTAAFCGAARAERPGSTARTDAPGPDAATTDDGAPLSTIEVVASPLRPDHADTQSANTIGPDELAQQNLTRLQDALGNVPGLTLNAGEGGAHGDAINLRGLSLPNDFFLDGLRDTGQYQRDTFALESVDVLLGPASVLFGWGSTAGAVNAISKKPMLQPLATAELAVGNAAHLRATADLNVPFADTAAARISAMEERSGIAGRDVVRNRRSGAAPTIQWGIGTADRVTLGLLHQTQDDIPDSGLPFVDGAPARVDPRNFYGLADYDRTRTDVSMATLRVEHDFDDEFSIVSSFRAAQDSFAYRLSAPHLDNDDTPMPAPGTPLANIRVYRDQPSSTGSQSQWIGRTELRGELGAGGNAQEIAAGLELSRQGARIDHLFNGIDRIAPTPLESPDPFEEAPVSLAVTGSTRAAARDAALYLTDRIALGAAWEVDLAARADQVESQFSEDSTASAFERTDRRLSPRAAAVYSPSARQTYSVAYGASFNPAVTYLSLAPSNLSLAPETDRSFQIGGRWVLARAASTGHATALSAALYDTKLANARVADPGDPTVQLAPFDQRVRGLELALAGEVAPGWNLTAGYTHIDARTSGSTDPLALGRRVANTPQDAFNAWSNVALGPAWNAGIGLRYLGHRFADADNTAGVPATRVCNAMLAYRADRRLGLQLNIDNLANARTFNSIYYAAPDENHAVPGPARSIILTVRLTY